jgi:hypothetical protein
MGQRRLVAIIGAIALTTVSCASEQTVDTTDTTAASPSPTVSPAASPGSSPAAQTFAKPLVAQKNPTAGFGAIPTVPGLIQPTNAKERGSQAITQAKADPKDPFAGLPPTPIKEAVRQQANTAAAGNNATGGNAGNNATGNTQQRRLPSGSALLPNPDVPPAIAVNVPKAIAAGTPRPAIVLPPKPSTDLAKGVEVTGVIVLQGVPQAIVKAPNESTSRYVRIGERLSNGKVLVKRIEMATDAEPVVILEENGVEVARGVGDKPIAQTGKPSA